MRAPIKGAAGEEMEFFMIEIEGGELSVAADLAAAMGASLFDARAIEKVLSGSAEGFESLRETYGITTAELQRMGVEVNKTGGLIPAGRAAVSHGSPSY